MASDPDHQGTEAYFQKFMTGKLHGKEALRVMVDPEFWDFLASECSMHAREWVAGVIMRRILDLNTTDPEHGRIDEKAPEGAEGFPSGERRLNECGENLQALYDSIPEGAKFRFLRGYFLSKILDVGEDERQAVSVGEEAKRENGNSEAQGEDERQAMSVGEEAKRENENSEAQGQQVWEWTESDSEAEPWLLEWDEVRVGGVARYRDRRSSAEVGRVWEWTDYDSEAER